MIHFLPFVPINCAEREQNHPPVSYEQRIFYNQRGIAGVEHQQTNPLPLPQSWQAEGRKKNKQNHDRCGKRPRSG